MVDGERQAEPFLDISDHVMSGGERGLLGMAVPDGFGPDDPWLYVHYSGPDDGETVLSAIMRSGARVMFGCRGGGCGTCKMRLISGRIDYGHCSVAVLSEAEREKARSCRVRHARSAISGSS